MTLTDMFVELRQLCGVLFPKRSMPVIEQHVTVTIETPYRKVTIYREEWEEALKDYKKMEFLKAKIMEVNEKW